MRAYPDAKMRDYNYSGYSDCSEVKTRANRPDISFRKDRVV